MMVFNKADPSTLPNHVIPLSEPELARCPELGASKINQHLLDTIVEPVMSNYQLDFVTPGSRPRWAVSRKQMRHSPNFLMYARARPQTWQRFTFRTENFGLRAARTIMLTFAIAYPLTQEKPRAQVRSPNSYRRENCSTITQLCSADFFRSAITWSTSNAGISA